MFRLALSLVLLVGFSGNANAQLEQGCSDRVADRTQETASTLRSIANILQLSLPLPEAYPVDLRPQIADLAAAQRDVLDQLAPLIEMTDDAAYEIRRCGRK